MASSMLHVRLDDELKARGTAALSAIGLSTADAVRILFHRIVADQAFPLELKVPNAETRAAMAESRKMMAEQHARFADGESLIEDLDSRVL